MRDFINKVLDRRQLPHVSNLREDLSSGSVLITVIEILSGKTPTRFVRFICVARRSHIGL